MACTLLPFQLHIKVPNAPPDALFRVSTTKTTLNIGSRSFGNPWLGAFYRSLSLVCMFRGDLWREGAPKKQDGRKRNGGWWATRRHLKNSIHVDSLPEIVLIIRKIRVRPFCTASVHISLPLCENEILLPFFPSVQCSSTHSFSLWDLPLVGSRFAWSPVMVACELVKQMYGITDWLFQVSGLTRYILSLMYGTVHAWRYKGRKLTYTAWWYRKCIKRVSSQY